MAKKKKIVGRKAAKPKTKSLIRRNVDFWKGPKKSSKKVSKSYKRK